MSESLRQNRIRQISPELKETVRTLRQTQTAAEDRLWNAIRAQRAFPYRVRRQHAVGRFVIDFWIPSARLAIEIDGSVHDDPEVLAQDRERAAILEAYDLKVVRFRNEEVLYELDRVVNEIRMLVDDAGWRL